MAERIYTMKQWLFEHHMNNDPTELQRLLCHHDKIEVQDDEGETLFFVVEVHPDGTYEEDIS